MFFIKCCLETERKPPYIKCQSYENLFVLPYVHGRLTFAQLATRAIEEGQFDVVAVDLPFFLQENKWLDFALWLFPFPSTLVIKTSMNESKSFNFVPNDAACAAVYKARQLQIENASIKYECIDDSNIINYPIESFQKLKLSVGDDYFAHVDGLDDFFIKIYKEMEQKWLSLTEEQKYFWNYRVTTVAKRLQQILKSGEKTLFVCDFRLWWLINKELVFHDVKDTGVFVIPWQDKKAALILQDPYFLWIKGVLDDYPAVVARFFGTVLKGESSNFNKLYVIEEIICEIIEEANSKKSNDLSIRNLQTFRHYLRKRLATHRRMTPSPTDDLYDAAFSCVGKSFARSILEKMLSYPSIDMEYVEFLTITHNNVSLSSSEFEIPDAFEQTFLNASDSLPAAYSYDEEKRREELAAQVMPFLKRKERMELKNYRGVTWALKKEYELHARVISMIHQVIEKKSRYYQSKKSWGSLKGGIDWKSTFRSQLQGENDIYIKKLRRHGLRSLRFNAFTPTVFIFDTKTEDYDCSAVGAVHDSNATLRNLELENDEHIIKNSPEPDCVNSVFYFVTDYQYACNNHILKGKISSILFLYGGEWMGTERYNRINLRPDKYQCREMPYDVPEIRNFLPFDMLVAFGAKYAERHIIVVADKSWQPSQQLSSFLKEKEVAMIRFPLTDLSTHLIERMKSLHIISTSLKKHSQRDIIVDRYVPDEFDS